MLELSHIKVNDVLGLFYEVTMGNEPSMIFLITGFGEDGAYKYVRLNEDDFYN